MKGPIAVTRAFPKFNGIVLMSHEEFTQFLEDRHSMNLIRMRRWVKNSFGCMDCISDNSNLGDVFAVYGIINTAPNSKQLCFSTCDMNYMMEDFGDGTIMNVCMQY